MGYKVEESNYLEHYGVLGMKWGVRRYQPYPKGEGHKGTYKGKKNKIKKIENTDRHIIKKGETISRIIPEEWSEKEKNYKGHAYASYKKEDIAKYEKISRMVGGGKNYVNMTYQAKEVLVAPSEKKRVDEFIKLMDSNPKARDALIKATRTPILFVPKKRITNLDKGKNANKVYRKFSFLLVSNRDIRDPYFQQLKDQGYNMTIDDGDRLGGISKAPIIVFDRQNSLELKTIKDIGKK